ncbi:MAG: hypothetical protein IJS60_01850 [Abditibacteriota bacterium]|nr:hypothetical protein [Abditibacteriota bacterium]
MKKIILCLLILSLTASAFASRLLRAGDSLIYVLTIDNTQRGTGDFFELKGDGLSDGVVVKYDKDLTFKKMVNSGCSYQVSFFDAVYDSKGYITVMGYASKEAFGTGILKDLKPKGGADIILVKYDMDLNIVKINNIGTKLNDWGNRIILSSKGNYIVVGHETDQTLTKAIIYSVDENLEINNKATFLGSFNKPSDSKFNIFYNVIETKSGDFALCGVIAKSYPEGSYADKGLVVVYDNKFKIKNKASFGTSTQWITLADLIEKPEGGFIIIGRTGGESEKGVLLDLDKNLLKTDVKFHFPTLSGGMPNYNDLLSIQPFTGNGGGYLIFGAAFYNKRGYVTYYMVYDSENGFEEICPLPELTDINYYVGPDSSFYIIGYDKEGNLSPNTNAWF